MTELFSVELEANKPEIVDVAIVEVAMVDDVIMLPPTNVVLPPCKARMLLFKFKVPLPAEIVLPLKVLATNAPFKVKAVPEAVVKVVCPVTFKLPVRAWLPSTIKFPVVVAFPEINNDCAEAGPLTFKLVPMATLPFDKTVK